ncbi:MAG TPA: PAS domain S-box protein [Candidatus Hydrogenedentes bacterium]|nr:PAS domain S-box protein [Candidatus Hydrogenedentota bacterium]
MTDTLSNLAPVIRIDAAKCVNCHACISACPVKFCNDGSGDFVTLDSTMCIGCGTCLSACTHGARYYVDDFEAFFQALAGGEKIVAITAPSVAANFPGQYRNLNGWLKSIGVAAVFDVSFGAELTVKSYVEYIRENNPEMVIAQPCPAIVTFIEIYHPDLLPYLAPCDSPMAHCMKMIRRYYPAYAEYKIAVMSPCVAKKREFQEIGIGDFNVGYQSLARYFKEQGISLNDFPEAEYDNPPAERAVLFSTPGGLRRSLARWLPEYAEETRKIEGVNSVYEYLRKLSEALREHRAPKLVDCLNCEMGCNGGPLTLAKGRPLDEVEHWVEQRRREMQAVYGTDHGDKASIAKVEAVLEEHWEKGLYDRHYLDRRSDNVIVSPSDAEREVIFHRMHKYSVSDIYNCTACGYMACREMATAVFNGKNKPENCHFYLAKEKSIANRHILEREQRFRKILETCLEGFLQINNDMTIEIVNDALCAMLDYAPEELIGRNQFELVAEDHHSILEEQVRLRSQGIHSTYEIDLVRKDGTRVNALFSASPLLDTNNQKIGAYALVSNISNMKLTEEELRRSRDELEQRVQERTREVEESNVSLLAEVRHRARMEKALRDSESQLQAIVHGCPIAQFVIDRNHKVISWNKPLEEYTGIKAEEMLGTSQQWKAFYPSERPCLADLLLENGWAEMRHLYGSKASPSKMVEGAYEATDFFPLMGKGGRWLYFMAALIRGPEGEVIGAVETLEDITDRKRAEEERINLERQIQHAQKLESLGVLAGGIAHDFNNLLASIMGNADLALMELPQDTTARGSIDLIVTTAQRAADLAKQMLAYSGKGQFLVESLDLSSVVNEMAHLLSVSVSKKAAVKYQLGDRLPKVQADATQVRQIIMNLITNASEALGDATGTITISTGSTHCDLAYLRAARIRDNSLQEGRYVYLEVEDTGCGMDKNTLECMFDPFFSTKFTGRGLGLSAVVGIVRGHKGTIEVHSEQNQGTRFRVLFPACIEEADTAASKKKKQDPLPQNGTILIVDDEEGIRTVAKKFLERKHFRVFTAQNGEEALRLFSTQPEEISCVVLDLTMPDMDGYEVFCEMQRIHSGVRVLMSSGFSEQEFKDRFAGKGVMGFIQKPYRLETFYTSIQKALSDVSSDSLIA